MPKGRILVVDDSPTELKLVTTSLAGDGYEVSTAVDGEEALAKALAEHPDLIVLDVVMPKKNGFQVCRLLKNTPETEDIKILMLTSRGEESDRFWGMKQGADAYLGKPFDQTELLGNIRKLL